MTDMGKRSGRVWTTISAWVLLAVVVVGAPGPVRAAEEAAADDGSRSAKLAPVVFPIDLGSIPAGATVTLEFDVQVDSPLTSFPAVAVANQGTVSGPGVPPVPTDDPDLGGTQDPTVTPLDTADLVLSKTDSPDPVIAGGSLQYLVTVLNNGPSTAENVVVTDTLPAGVTFVSTAGCAEDPAGVPTCTLGSIPASTSPGFIITVAVDPTTAGSLVNNAAVFSTTAEANPGQEAASATTTVMAEADISVAMTDTVDPVIAGENLGYTIMVANGGLSDDPATVTVTDTLPAGVSYVSATGAGWTCGEAAGIVTCTRAGLAVGPAPDIDVVVLVDPETRGSLSNTVTVSSPTTDPNAGNDSATEGTTVDAEADLGLTKTASASPLPPGDPLVYTLTVTNVGPSSATDVVVTDTLPAGVTLDSTSGCAEDPNAVPVCTLGAIAVGGSAQYTITVTIDPSPPPSITNTATTTGVEFDPDLGNNEDSVETILDSVPPTVTVLNTIGDTGDGQLDECETATVEINTFLWSFSEEIYDPPGDSDPDDVTNPDNFRVLAPGADFNFATDLCGPVLGDDVAVNIPDVSYSVATDTASVLMGGTLPPSLYRVMACGSTTIVDLAGNPLDGTGNGTGGDDYVLTFRADPDNAFANGHFDCDLAGWTLTSATPGEITYSPDDADNSDLSGSAAVMNLAMNTDFALSQCAATHPGLDLPLTGRMRFSAAPTVFASVSSECVFYSAPGCAGANLGSSVVTVLAGDTAGAWVSIGASVASPDGAVSAVCSFRISNPTGANFTAWLDQLFFDNGNSIFADGFESGNTSAWSVVQGE